MGRLGAALAALLAMTLSACLPVTTQVPAGGKQGADPALIGAWRVMPSGQDEDAPDSASFIATADGTLTAVLIATGSAQKPGSYEIFRLTTGRAGALTLMNVHPVFADGAPESAADAAMNVPLLYRFDGGRLRLYLIDEAAAKAAIAAGRIAGKIDHDDAVITAPQAELDAFLASAEGAHLFTKPLLVLKRSR